MTETFLIFDALLVLLVAVAIFMRRAKKLRLHESVFEDSIDISGQGLIFFDEDENFRMANKQAHAYIPLLNADGDDSQYNFATLKDFLDYMFDHAVECDESLKAVLDRMAEYLGVEGFREVIEWEGGKLCIAEARMTEAGRTVITLRDLSNVKRDEDNRIQLNQYNFELTEAIEATTNGVFIVEGQHKDTPAVVFANKAILEYIDFSKDAVIGQSIRDVLYEFLGEDGWDSVEQAFDQDESVDLEVQTVDGVIVRWFNFKLTPVKAACGTSLLFIGVCTETTELKQREAEVSQAQKLDALGKLAAGVAHDFNNILSIIDGYAHIASRELGDDDSAKSYLDKIRLASARGADLTRQMLTFSRHKIVVDSVIDLGEILQEQEILIQPLVDASIDMIFYLHDPEIFVDCTADSLTQIVMNLVVNAADAMPDGGKLVVELRKVDRKDAPLAAQKEVEGDVFACLSVADTGEGMDRATLERIFDPFFTTKGQGKGTGLGLSMVYGLVSQMGGFVDVQTSLNEGTTFFVYFSLSSKTPQKIIQNEEDGVTTTSLEGYTALVAEDEPELLSMVANMLEELGMKVITAANGDEALVEQEDYEGKIDLLLTDVVMPELDGVKLASLFISLRPDVKTIFMSGYPANGQLARVELPEGALFVAKPIHYESLTKIIVQTLSGDQTGALEKSMPRWETSEDVQSETMKEVGEN